VSDNADISDGLLFPVPESLSPRLAWCKRVKEELGIFTHFCQDSRWMAFSFTRALVLLGGYSLTDEEKAHPVSLFAGYCRLLDEAGYVADHMETEEDAIEFVAMAHGVKLWNEEVALVEHTRDDNDDPRDPEDSEEQR